MKGEYGKMNKGDLHMPVVESYQPSDKEFAGQQMGRTTEYIERRDKIQSSEASKVKSQVYHGRYE